MNYRLSTSPVTRATCQQIALVQRIGNKMCPRIPVSAVVITKNVEDHLDETLRSLAICDEIVVLDSGSTDRTREIALRHGARWHEHVFDGYGPQKCRAMRLARHDWILSVDADEVLDHAALMGIAAVDWPTADLTTCWRIRRRTFIGDREIKYGHWARERPVRIFNRLATGVEPVLVHESVRRDDAGPGSSGRDPSPQLSRFERGDSARLPSPQGRPLSARRPLSRRPASRPACRMGGSAQLSLRGGCLEGGAGVVIALSAAVNATMGLAMASETGEVAPRAAAPGRLVPVTSAASGRVVYPKTA